MTAPRMPRSYAPFHDRATTNGNYFVTLTVSVDESVAQSMAIAPLKEAPFSTEVALATSKMRLSYRDPADTFLAATAKVFDLTLVTTDARMLTAKGISRLPNR